MFIPTVNLSLPILCLRNCIISLSPSNPLTKESSPPWSSCYLEIRGYIGSRIDKHAGYKYSTANKRERHNQTVRTDGRHWSCGDTRTTAYRQRNLHTLTASREAGPPRSMLIIRSINNYSPRGGRTSKRLRGHCLTSTYIAFGCWDD